MFRRHHTESAVMSSTPVRVRTVRVLADDEELFAAVPAVLSLRSGDLCR
jgi:hypothetical protein